GGWTREDLSPAQATHLGGPFARQRRDPRRGRRPRHRLAPAARGRSDRGGQPRWALPPQREEEDAGPPRARGRAARGERDPPPRQTIGAAEGGGSRPTRRPRTAARVLQEGPGQPPHRRGAGPP